MRSIASRLFLVALLLAPAGCGSDEIRTYTVPREKAPATAHPAPPGGKVRLLAAIVPHKKDMWFLKLIGPSDEVGEKAEAFEELVKSITFADEDNPVAWTHPKGWTTTRHPQGLRYATVHTGEAGKELEVSVFRFPPSGLKSNIDRWRLEELGLPPIDKDDIAKVTKKVTIKDDSEATLVDLTGPGKGVARRPGHIPGGPKKPRPLPITYTTPKGWEETGPRLAERMGIRVKIFTAFDVDEGKKAEVTVQQYPKAMVSQWTFNINRWRGEVGLGSVRSADRSKERTLKVAGIDSTYVDVAGSTKRSLVVVVIRGGEAWFFKLLGDKGVVGDNKSKFETFVKSVKFTGAADE